MAGYIVAITHKPADEDDAGFIKKEKFVYEIVLVHVA
jgi:hypothetical protein